ncbi:hypothetical protein FRC12_018037 [Ceratobasidium sp. 428]|nr:hypothetical protein FRC12_018037 [Ceratobasidium sp. 428]
MQAESEQTEPEGSTELIIRPATRSTPHTAYIETSLRCSVDRSELGAEPAGLLNDGVVRNSTKIDSRAPSGAKWSRGIRAKRYRPAGDLTTPKSKRLAGEVFPASRRSRSLESLLILKPDNPYMCTSAIETSTATSVTTTQCGDMHRTSSLQEIALDSSLYAIMPCGHDLWIDNSVVWSSVQLVCMSTHNDHLELFLSK